MTIKYLKDEDLLEVTANEINSFVGSIGTYSNVSLTGQLTCKDIPPLKYNTTEVLVHSSTFYISAGKLYIRPSYFGLANFKDGVYNISLVFKFTNDNVINISSCVFIDIKFKCKVASFLDSFLRELKNPTIEKQSTLIHLIHYALTNGSACGCNCIELCDLFKELEALLDSVVNTNNCGC